MKWLSKILLLGIVIIALTFIFSACKNTPNRVLSEDEMVELLTEMTIAESYKNVEGYNLSETEKANLGEAILAKHGYTYEQLDSSLNWYGRNLDKYYDLCEKVDKEIYKRQKKIAKLSGSPEQISESYENLWPYPDHFWITPLGGLEGINFNITGAGLLKGESLEWKFRLNTNGNIKALLGAEYEDGTVSYASGGTYGQRKLNVNLVTDTSKQVKRIIGIAYADKGMLPIWADSVQLVKLPYDSASYYRINGQRRYHR